MIMFIFLDQNTRQLKFKLLVTSIIKDLHFSRCTTCELSEIQALTDHFCQ